MVGVFGSMVCGPGHHCIGGCGLLGCLGCLLVRPCGCDVCAICASSSCTAVLCCVALRADETLEPNLLSATTTMVRTIIDLYHCAKNTLSLLCVSGYKTAQGTRHAADIYYTPQVQPESGGYWREGGLTNVYQRTTQACSGVWEGKGALCCIHS